MGGDRAERGQAAERRARLAETLRSNLHRRKAQARERRHLEAGENPAAPGGDGAGPGRAVRPGGATLIDGGAPAAAGTSAGDAGAETVSSASSAVDAGHAAVGGRGEDRA